MGWDVADGDVHVKGAWLKGSPIFALKAATGFTANRERGLPTSSGFVMIFDAATGQPCALLADDGYLTELRTGAAGALAASLLAVPNVRKIAMIGAGGQARFQLRAIAQAIEWKEAASGAFIAERCAAYAQEMTAALDKPVHIADSVEEAVRNADLIVTTTPARRALVHETWVKPGATVIAVGADSPGKQELDPLLLVRADKVIVDLVRQAARLGELQHVCAPGSTVSAANVHGELGAVLTKTMRRARIVIRTHHLRPDRHGRAGCRDRRSRLDGISRPRRETLADDACRPVPPCVERSFKDGRVTFPALFDSTVLQRMP